jgi:hypothetical protein
MNVKVNWRFLKPSRDEGWNNSKCLYAYLAKGRREILYIGKSWSVSVRRRWDRYAKESFWDDLENERNMHKHYVLLGEVLLLPGKRLSQELLRDIESLLINQIDIWGNIQCRKRRINRQGLIVDCLGEWPLHKKRYIDVN